jgi:hypothetical protein
MLGILNEMKSSKSLLHDHRSLKLNTDDYQRVCRIPKRKVFVDPLPQNCISIECFSSINTLSNMFRCFC